MTAEIKHTLLNLEVPPPTGAWNAIALRLDTEFDSAEIKVAEKMDAFEMAPPAAAWSNIAAVIVNDPEEVEQAPVIMINRPFRRWAMAAAAILVVAFGGWYMLNNSTAPENGTAVIPVVTPNSVLPTPETQEVTRQNASSDNSATRPLPRKTPGIIASAKRLNVSNAVYVQDIPDYTPAVYTDFRHVGLQPIESVNTLAMPNVEAPPIRDATGNIIMDQELIFSPANNNYIVVTGPNGEQTRISSKFLPLLSSMNGKAETMDYFQFFLNDNNIWKLRFNEWRDKMLKNASFIPTATNLLDLIELKEILEEN